MRSLASVIDDDESVRESLPDLLGAAYRRDVPNAQVHVLDAGHFALDTAADEIVALLRGFVEASPYEPSTSAL
jgi:pimeloyl-ACP methyl ester carboxylesterase